MSIGMTFMPFLQDIGEAVFIRIAQAISSTAFWAFSRRLYDYWVPKVLPCLAQPIYMEQSHCKMWVML
jgi:hypothetical protein